MRLVEQGKIDLSAPVQKYVADFRVQDEAVSREVTIWHLLTHTPGWEGQLTAEDRGVNTLAGFLDVLRPLPQLAPPGTVWSYNNAGFTLAGRVIEVVSGPADPRGVADARVPADRPDARVHAPRGRRVVSLLGGTSDAVGQSHRAAAAQPIQLAHCRRRVDEPQRSLKYATFHLGDGTAGGQRVLARASLDQMRAPKLRKAGTDEEMGLGWHLRTLGGVTTAAHGGTLGHCLLLELVPARNLVLAILTNHTDGWRLIQDVERAALKQLEGLTLNPAQAIGHRGVNETMPDAPLLAKQPDPAPYLGMYRRPPVGTVTVTADGGQFSWTRARWVSTHRIAPSSRQARSKATRSSSFGGPMAQLAGCVSWAGLRRRISARKIKSSHGEHGDERRTRGSDGLTIRTL